jgi:hypothetical protein
MVSKDDLQPGAAMKASRSPFVCIVVFLTAPIAQAQPIEVLLASGTENPRAIYEWVITQPPLIAGSPDQGESFAADYVAFGRLKGERDQEWTLHRLCFDSEVGNPVKLSLDRDGVLNALLTSSESRYFLDSRWQTTGANWAFVIGGPDPELRERKRSVLEPEQKGGLIYLDFAAAIRHASELQPPRQTWSAQHRLLTIVNDRPISIFVEFATPTDQLLTGEILSRFHWVTRFGTWEVMRNMTRRTTGVPRLKRPLGYAVPPRHLVPPIHPETGDIVLNRIQVTNAEPSQRVWDGIWRVPPVDPLAAVTAAWLRNEQKDIGAGFAGTQASNTKTDVNKEIKKFAIYLWGLRGALDWPQHQDAQPQWFDSPAWRWQQAEMVLTPQTASRLVRQTLPAVLQNKRLPLSTRIAFAASVADLGCPPHEPELEQMSTKFLDADLMMAVLRSGWNRPLTTQQHAALSAAVEHPESAVVDKVERDDVEFFLACRWVAATGSSALSSPLVAKQLDDLGFDWSNGVMGRCLIRLLSQTRDGLQELIDRLPKMSSESSRYYTAQILAVRLRAMLETRRFEQFSQDECLARLETLAPYLDPNIDDPVEELPQLPAPPPGPAAKPFPEDL